MTDYSDIDARLGDYSDAFDFYMERGEMPPSVPADDCLGAYMREVIDNNPQIDGSDPTWAEVLKEDLIAFFGVLLGQFRAAQAEAQAELGMISRFADAPIEQKRGMWQQVRHTIEAGYSSFEVNLPGYTAQFRTDDRDAVFAALTGDWRAACMEKLDRTERAMLERAKPQFEKSSREAGTRDYEDRKKVEKFICRYPQLKEIVDLIGRDKDPSHDERDTVVMRFMPTSVARNSAAEEIDRVESGDNLERVLPAELAMPDDLFFKRYATKELRQFASPGKDKPKKVEERRKDPRLTKGPVVVAIDTSGSMSGLPQQIAFSLLKQLLRMAKKQKRPCYLISFSVRAKSIDLASPRNWGKLDSFLEHSFSGGTDGEQMLAEALRVLKGGDYGMADVLIISDLQFPAPARATRVKIDREKELGTRFYALQIGSWSHDYAGVLDRIWQV